MANTLNLGTDGNWATKEGSVLGYNSESNNYKPLPFDFTRASSATVVNKGGLIETVGSGEPRIDFKDNTKGALLLEPSRSNLITYSQDFSNSYWSKLNSSIISNSVISPDGTLNADKIIDNTVNTAHRFISTGITTTATNYTFSIFVKKSEIICRFSFCCCSLWILSRSSISDRKSDRGTDELKEVTLFVVWS